MIADPRPESQDVLTTLLADLLDYGPPPGDWAQDGLCAQTDPEAFFPGKGGSVRAAKRICSRCPVQQSCKRYAIETGQKDGVWGGLSANELRAETRAAAA